MNAAVEKLLAIARAEIGYREKETNANLDSHAANAGDENYTKYARDLARAGYYQANKNGYDWCDVWCDWCFLQLCGGRALAERVQCQTGPYGAGCRFSADYYKAQGRLDRNFRPGDQIFFGDYDHTGLVEDVRNGRVYTIEGNSCNQVMRHDYAIGSGYLTSVGHPRYDLVPAPAPAPVPTVAGFADVPAGAYYADAVRWAADNRVVEGIAPGQFGPEQVCTRAQAVTMVWRMQGSPEPEGIYRPFDDVQPAAYYAKAAQWAADQGICVGTGGNRFDPLVSCTRAEMVVMLWRLAGAPGTATNAWHDVDLGDWYKDAANWALHTGITKGVGHTNFGPGDACTRAMAVTMLHRYSQL